MARPRLLCAATFSLVAGCKAPVQLSQQQMWGECMRQELPRLAEWFEAQPIALRPATHAYWLVADGLCNVNLDVTAIDHAPDVELKRLIDAYDRELAPKSSPEHT